jgi:FkbM family methyltransferase
MKQLANGWYVPDNEQKITSALIRDLDKNTPSYEGTYRQYILNLIPNKRTFVDVGANVGIWSLSLSYYFNKIIAYEPSLQNLECLERNIPDTINIRKVALANFEGKADFHQGGKNCGDGKLSRSGRKSSYSVNVTTLDIENIKNVDLIKIDVQGWELEVLQGAIETINGCRPWIIFEVNDNIDICCSFLEKNGYETLRLKSKRLFLYVPLKGHNSVKPEYYGRYLGPGPYANKLNKLVY